MEFSRGQQVTITSDHNHLKACNDTLYRVEATNKVNGCYSVILSLNGSVVGAIYQEKLRAK